MTGKIGLVLAGGGARAAYQAVVLAAHAELVPEPRQNPFSIICGTSAGAINAAALAVGADDFAQAVSRLVSVWRHFEPRQVYRSDLCGVVANSCRWVAGLLFGAILANERTSLLDNRPLELLLSRHLDFSRIAKNIDAGALDAVAITCSGYTSGQSCSFFEGAEHLAGGKRSQRVGIKTRLALGHLLASSAIPFLFAPHHLHREYFGDGSMRQVAPLSPALHLGADRLVVIGTARINNDSPQRSRGESFPTLAQIAGHVMDSIFLDSLAVDLERLERINRTVATVPAEGLRKAGLSLHQVDVLVLTPSEPLEAIALRHMRRLPWTIRTLLRLVGAMRRGGATLASYLLFEQGYCRELVELGYRDTLARRDEIAGFLNAGSAQARRSICARS
jgi:NTE family protein